MKNILIFPPQWSPLSPHSALTILSANLRANGYETLIKDLNIEFYNHILTRNNIEKVIGSLLLTENIIKGQLSGEFSEDKAINEYSEDFNIKASKFLKINELQGKDRSKLDNVLKLLPYAVKVMRDKTDFYSINLFSKALLILDYAFYMISLNHYPSELSMHDFVNPVFKYKFDQITNHCTDKSLNIFYDFCEKKVPEITKENPDFIGISIGSYSQFIAGLTFAKFLKENCNAHITIGGNYISRIADSIEKCPEFFETFADSILFEEGEKPVVELVKYLDNKLDIKEVSNLMYLDDDGNIIKNSRKEPLKLNETPTPSLEGFDLNTYFMPEIVMPILASRGCYWKKCTFCDHDFGQTYNVKSIDKLISELKELNQKYGISYFEFVDEAISASYLQKLSEKILEEGLDINWYCNARLETNLTEDILKLARKAGLRMILWGFESGSGRIMDLINKGIDTDKRFDVLRAANNADIWNFAYIFFGFPTETEAEAMETANAVCNNIDIIHAYGKSIFSLGKHALMKLNPEKYGITNLSAEEEEFSSNCSYKIESGLSSEQLEKINKEFMDKSTESYPSPAWMYIRYRETLFLYICKYGADAVKAMEVPF